MNEMNYLRLMIFAFIFLWVVYPLIVGPVCDNSEINYLI